MVRGEGEDEDTCTVHKGAGENIHTGGDVATRDAPTIWFLG